MELGLLLLRVAFGLALAAHGAQKLFGWFGGYGIKGTGGWLGSLGMPYGNAMAVMAGLGELCGGMLLAFGLFTPLASGLIIAVMLVAVMTAHAGKGFFNTNGGGELPLLIAAAALSVAFIGPGRISLDWAFGFETWGPAAGPIALGIGLMGCASALALRSVSRKRDATVG